MFINKLFTYLTCVYQKNKRRFNVKSSIHFHIKTEIFADFQICISVPVKVISVKCFIYTYNKVYTLTIIIFFYNKIFISFTMKW